MLQTFDKMDIFIRVCTERMMDHQYGENRAKSIYLNYNQIRAYVECSSNSPENIYI